MRIGPSSKYLVRTVAGQGQRTPLADPGGTAAKRSTALPDVPSMVEAGFKGQDADAAGRAAACRTPKAIVTKLHADIARALSLL